MMMKARISTPATTELTINEVTKDDWKVISEDDQYAHCQWLVFSSVFTDSGGGKGLRIGLLLDVTNT